MAGLVDRGRDDPESYDDAIGRVIRQESWMKIEKKLNPNVDEGLNVITCLNLTQLYGNR